MGLGWGHCNYQGSYQRERETDRRVRVREGDVRMEVGVKIRERFEEASLLALKVEGGP